MSQICTTGIKKRPFPKLGKGRGSHTGAAFDFVRLFFKSSCLCDIMGDTSDWNKIQQIKSEGIKMVENMHGVWVGENAAIAITKKMQISFIRLPNNDIVSILRQANEDIIGVVYGHGRNDNNLNKIDSCYCTTAYKDVINTELIQKHQNDEIYLQKNKLYYKLHDGTVFPCVLAEKITISANQVIPPVDDSMNVAQKLELWNLGARCFYGKQYEQGVWGGIDTRKYSICFNLNKDGSGVYCRFGKNGYTLKGQAMLSTICLRDNEVRMIENNMDNLDEYEPILDAFIVDGCSFPEDGGWYWAVKEISDDCIKLCGCGGDTYETYRISTNNHEFIV